MGEHGGEDVGVVDLASCRRELSAQRDQELGYRWPVLQHIKSSIEPLYIIKYIATRNCDWPRLRPSEHCQILAQHLTADSNGLPVSRGASQLGPSYVMARCCRYAGVYKNIGVDEHYG